MADDLKNPSEIKEPAVVKDPAADNTGERMGVTGSSSSEPAATPVVNKTEPAPEKIEPAAAKPAAPEAVVETTPAASAEANNGGNSVPPQPPKDENKDAAQPAPKAQPAAAGTPGNDEEEAAKLGSKFISDQDVLALLREHLKRNRLARELEEVLALSDMGKSAFARDEKGQVSLTLGVNQHKIEFSQMPDGAEFIGLHKAHSEEFDAHDARVIVGLAKTKGWDSIEVHGNEPQKDALWLEAMRQGIGVENFEPKPESEARKQWELEKGAQAPAASVSPPKEQMGVAQPPKVRTRAPAMAPM